jgi:hypothetical protein
MLKAINTTEEDNSNVISKALFALESITVLIYVAFLKKVVHEELQVI